MVRLARGTHIPNSINTFIDDVLKNHNTQSLCMQYCTSSLNRFIWEMRNLSKYRQFQICYFHASKETRKRFSPHHLQWSTCHFRKISRSTSKSDLIISKHKFHLYKGNIRSILLYVIPVWAKTNTRVSKRKCLCQYWHVPFFHVGPKIHLQYKTLVC